MGPFAGQAVGRVEVGELAGLVEVEGDVAAPAEGGEVAAGAVVALDQVDDRRGGVVLGDVQPERRVAQHPDAGGVGTGGRVAEVLGPLAGGALGDRVVQRADVVGRAILPEFVVGRDDTSRSASGRRFGSRSRSASWGLLLGWGGDHRHMPVISTRVLGGEWQAAGVRQLWQTRRRGRDR